MTVTSFTTVQSQIYRCCGIGMYFSSTSIVLNPCIGIGIQCIPNSAGVILMSVCSKTNTRVKLLRVLLSGYSVTAFLYNCLQCDVIRCYLTRLISHGGPGQVHSVQSHQRRLQKTRSRLGVLGTAHDSRKKTISNSRKVAEMTNTAYLALNGKMDSIMCLCQAHI